MCGIGGIYMKNDEPAPVLLLAVEWAMLATRGTDASGFAWRAVDQDTKTWHQWFKGAVASYDHVEEMARFLEAEPPQWMMMHCRHQTKGDKKNNENNHPVHSPGASVVLVHNGMIYNDDELFRTRWKDQQRPAMVDTIALATAIAIGGMDELLQSVEGSIAIAYSQRREPNVVNLYTNGHSPLWVWEDDDKVAWSSTQSLMPLGLMSGEGKGRTLTAGEFVRIAPDAVEYSQIGTGLTDTVRQTTYGVKDFDEKWKGSGGRFKCYNDMCKNKQPFHTHKQPSYNNHGKHNHQLSKDQLKAAEEANTRRVAAAIGQGHFHNHYLEAGPWEG